MLGTDTKHLLRKQWKPGGKSWLNVIDVMIISELKVVVHRPKQQFDSLRSLLSTKAGLYMAHNLLSFEIS